MSQDDTLRLVGTVVAEKYRVDSLVAEGGFALLYRATHQIWKRPVALKVFKTLSEALQRNKEELVASFIREGALLADLSERSASICQARDVGMLTTPAGDSIPYMVLEWLEGRSFEAVLVDEREKKVPPRSLTETMNLLGPIGEALALAHTMGVAHRDVKPANIFLLGDPRSPTCPVKLLDFGIAKVVMDAQKADGAFASTTGALTAFTPSYAAPEQFSRSHGATGPWTDTFALALVVIECVTGKVALAGDDLLQIAYAATNPNERPTPRALGANVADEVDAVFRKALAVNVADRYAHVGDFWNALRMAMGQEPMTITPPSSWVGSESNPTPAMKSSQPYALSQSGRISVLPGGASLSATEAARLPAPPPAGSRGVVVAVSVAGALATMSLLGWGVMTALRGVSKPRPAPVVAVPPPPSASVAPPTPARRCPDGMVFIEGGQFFMGSDDGLPMEKPSHNVKLSPYCIGIYEVTTAQYVACSEQGKCKRASRVNEYDGISAADRKVYDPLCNVTDPAGRALQPINCVDWERSRTYCEAQGGRLPTEAEWEFAARGPDGRTYPWGDEPPSAKYLNACGAECVKWGKAHHVDLQPMYPQSDGWETTAPVGSFPAGKSRYGLMDVVGNVWEWVDDWYAPYGDGAETDPKGPATGKARVIRGGGWNGSFPSWVRPTFRYFNDPATTSHGVGFRCAANPR